MLELPYWDKKNRLFRSKKSLFLISKEVTLLKICAYFHDIVFFFLFFSFPVMNEWMNSRLYFLFYYKLLLNFL